MSAIRFRIWDQRLKQYWHALDGATRHGIVMTSDGTIGMVCDLTTIYEPKSINYFESTHLTTERWTGLTDKTGRDIYEGDFVVTSNDGKDGADQWDADDYDPALVTMDTQGVHMCAQGHLKEQGYCWSWDDEDSVHNTRYLKVVGNIHEFHAA